MELRQLRYLVALADHQHFTRAAEHEHVSQPALSQQIQKLEAEVGVPLVERTTRRVRLTDAGGLLVVRARRILAEVQGAEAEIGALTGLRSGHVTVGTTSTLGAIDLSEILATYHQRHPGVELTVREGLSDGLAAMVREDEADVAFFSVTGSMDRTGLVLHELMQEELVVVLPAVHRLGRRKGLTITDLQEERFVSFREGTRLRELLVEAARDAGFVPRLAFESDAVARVRDVVAQGLGVALLPQSDAAAGDDRLRVVPLTAPKLARDVTVAWRAGRRLPPAARAFAELTLEYAAVEP